MVATAVEVKHKVLESELEALLVEAHLINTYQPEFNTLLKDDKSPLYIHITNEPFPRVIQIRKKELLKKQLNGKVLGPFSSAYKVQEVLKIARKIFPWCNKKIEDETKRNCEQKPCFYYHIDQCPGACIGKITPAKYQENIEQLVLFLSGKKKLVTKNLEIQLQQAISKEEFEKAATIRDQLALIRQVTHKSHSLKPELTTPALQNRVSEDGIIYLQQILAHYLGYPKQYSLERIEGYDVSNIQGTNPAVALVTFTNGKADTDNYRIFNIKSLDTPNDFQMLQEAVTRRQNHPEWGTPNLLLIDGGKGQVRAVLKVWRWYCPVIGIAKNPDRLVLPYTVHSDKNQKKMSPIFYHIVKLEENHPTLKLIQQIRDEAHRFSQKQHKKKRLEKMFQ